MRINRNICSSTSSQTAASWFYLLYPGNLQFGYNKITIEEGTNAVWVYNSYNTSTSFRTLLNNNVIFMRSTQGTASGIGVFYSSYVYLYHNTVVMDGSGAAFRIENQNSTGWQNCRSLNNLFTNIGSGTCLNSSTGSNSPFWGNDGRCNYNAYFSPKASDFISYDGSTYNTMSSWQSAGYDLDSNSVLTNPGFKSLTIPDLHTSSAAINGIGEPASAIVPIDMDGQTRSTTTPDLGADEFTPSADDISFNSIPSPVAGSFCGDSFVKFDLSFSNAGLNSASNIPIKVIITKGSTLIDSFTYIYTATLASGASASVTLNTGRLVNAYLGGSYTFLAYSRYATDGNRSNDTLSVTANYIGHMKNPIGTGASSCAGTTSLTLNATWPTGGRQDSLFWYDAAGNRLGAGPSFKTPVISTTTTYYVQADVARYHVGPIDYRALSGTLYGWNPNNYGLYFDALKDVRIDSVTVNVSGAGTVLVTIEDASGNTLGSTSTYVPVGGYANYQIPVGINVPTGTDNYIFPSGSGVGAMSGSTVAGGVGYPFSNRDVDITNSSLGLSWYLFFYDWVIADTGACPSQKIPVTATVGTGGQPTAMASISKLCSNDSTIITDMSTIPASSTISSVKVDFGDGNNTIIGAGKTIKHKYAAGTYKVVITTTSSTGCSDDSTYSITVNATPKAKLTVKSPNGCEGNAVTFYDSTSVTSGTYTRSWSYAVTNTTANEWEYTFAASGAYTLMLRSTANGCSDSASVNVTVNPKPVAKFGYNSFCGDSVNFLDSSTTSSGSITNWNWTYGDSKTGKTQNPGHTYPALGKYNTSLSVTNSFGCTSTNLALKVVEILPAVSGDFTNKITANQVDFKAVDSLSGTYAWEFGDLTTDNTKNPTHFYGKAGAYKVQLTVTNANGCTDVDTQTVVITGLEENATAQFGLKAYPNPFNERTIITYNLTKSLSVSLQISDVLGRVIANLQNGVQTSGTHNVEFNTPVTEKSGVYFVRLIVGDKVVTKEIIRVK